MTQSIGDRTPNLRERGSWSQERLASAAAVSSRNLQRIEAGEAKPTGETLQGIASAFGLTVEQMSTSLSAEDIASLRDQFMCPTCYSSLIERATVPNDFGDDVVEIFDCGFTRGAVWRPCPDDPKFPTFEDYDIHYEQDNSGTRWYAHAMGRTSAARAVSIQMGAGASRDEAAQDLRRHYARFAKGG